MKIQNPLTNNDSLSDETEVHLNAKYSDIKNTSEKDVKELIHELQMSQIVLNVQNEELIKTQHELQKSRDRYFDLYNFAPAGYLTVDPTGIILDANITTSILFNTKRSEIIGKNAIEFIGIEDQEVYRSHIKELISTHTRQACVIQMLRKDSDVFYSRCESDFVQDENGNENLCTVFLDVTECKLAEESLKQTVEALSKSNTELERFAYVASHDLREPLHNISSCAQLLNLKYNDALDAEGKQLINYALESVQQMNALISDLLTYSSHGKNSGKFEPVDCNYILGHVLENLHQLITETFPLITYDELPVIIADSTQMVQLFQNLISNAIKHHGEGEIKIHIGVERQDNYWLFSIKDNGSGIEEQYLEKIFEIFRRLETRSKYRGTGIGLAICQQVARSHNGQIWAESSIGEGTIFYITLPAT